MRNSTLTKLLSSRLSLLGKRETWVPQLCRLKQVTCLLQAKEGMNRY
jgi:hypothetical protein